MFPFTKAKQHLETNSRSSKLLYCVNVTINVLFGNLRSHHLDPKLFLRQCAMLFLTKIEFLI